MILKILDARPDGEALTSEIARELAVLDSAGRKTFPSHPIENGIFGTGFVISPGKGVWRITDKGRNYVRSNPSRGGRSTETGQPLQQAEPANALEAILEAIREEIRPENG